MKYFSRKTPKEATPRQTHRREMFILLFFIAVLSNWTGFHFEIFKSLEFRSNDLFFRLRNHIHAPTIPDNIVIVAIDEPSMQEFNLQWPWPRRLHGDLVSALHKAGAAVIGFDVVFSEPEDAESDHDFALAIKRAGNVVLAEDRKITEERLYDLTTEVLPLPILQKAAKNTGLVWLMLDDDGFVRRAELEQDNVFPFALVIAEVYRTHQGRHVDPDNPVSTFNLLHETDTPIIINYLGAPRSVKTVSYYQALDYRRWLPEGFFRNKIVLIGFNLAAPPDIKISDHFSYPYLSTAHAQISGVEIHATLVDTLLRERYLQTLPQVWQQFVFIIFLAVGAILLWRSSHWKGALFVTGLVGAFLICQFLFFYSGHYLTYVVTPLSALMLFLIAERVYGYAVVDREKRFIRQAFGHYISPAVVNQLIEHPEKLNLYGEFYDTTVVFTDLAGFTSLSEKMEPMDLRELLTEYFSEMVEAMLTQNGTLDKFIGDAMMCFFGVPVRTPEHARQGVLTAWEMQHRLQRLNTRWIERKFPPLSMRIGINSGRVVAGNMGTTNVFNYTIMGDPVNLGARLESANKQYGTNLMMGETTYNMTKGEFDTRWLDCIRVKGKEQAVSVYELLGPVGTMDGPRMEQIRLYESAFAAYLKQDFQTAIQLLEQLLHSGHDQPAVVLKERCESYLQSPPGDDWDGVYTMTSK
jgi:adenylate cyclase